VKRTTLPLQYDEVKMQLTKHNKSKNSKTLSFQVGHYKGLQLMYSNLWWMECLSQKTLISTCMQYHVNIIFLSSTQIQLWDCIFIPNHIWNPLFWMSFFFFSWGTQGLYS